MRLTAGISLDFRGPIDPAPVMERIVDTGFDTLLAVLESESDEAGRERVRSAVAPVEERGLGIVAYLADGSKRLSCLSLEEEIDHKLQEIQSLAGTGVAGIIFRGFATRCYYCEECAESLERATGLKLPPQVIGNPEEARKWYSPDPFVHGFDSPYNRGNRIQEVLQIVDWMGEGLDRVASRLAAAAAEVNPGFRLGLAGLNPIGLRVLKSFSSNSVPIVVSLPNTFITSDELDFYMTKLPFDGLRKEWTNLVATSAYYHTPEEIARIILKAGIEGRHGAILWAAGGVHMSFGRLEDVTPEYWAAVKRAFRIIRDYDEECEETDDARGLYWTRKGMAQRGGMV